MKWILEKYEGQVDGLGRLLAAPLVHVAVCGGVRAEEREYLAPFFDDLEDTIDISIAQVTDADHRINAIEALAIWVQTLPSREADEVRMAVKASCEQIALAVAEGESRVSAEENQAIHELTKTLSW